MLSAWSAHAQPWLNAGWQHHNAITIDNTRVSPSGNTDLANFPVLISLTHADLRDTANGGLVGQSDGGDIAFTTADEVTQIAHELESYDPTTGTIVAWVNVPAVSATVDTVIYIYYGNAGVVDQWNANGTWDAMHVGVWHFREAVANGVAGLLDSTAGGAHATPQGFAGTAGSTTNAPGRFGRGIDFGRNDDLIDIPSAVLNGRSNCTVSFWFRTNYTNIQKIVSGANAGNDNEYGVTLNNATEVIFGTGETAGSFLSWTAPTFNNNVWHHMVMVRNQTAQNATLYVDGAVVSTQGTTLSNLSVSAGGFIIGQDQDSVGGGYDPTQSFGGTLDELRVSNTVRSIDWVQTSFNNQSVPATFHQLGPRTESPLVPPELNFTAAASTTEEGVDTVVLTVTLSKPVNQVVTVNYATVDGSAFAASDFVGQSGTLTYQVAETSKTITLQMTGDAAYEAPESASIVLSAPTNAALGATATHTLTIVDDDLVEPETRSTVTFHGTSFTVNESAGFAEVGVSLSRASDQDVIVSVDTEATDSAVAGLDYTLMTPTVRIPAGTLGANVRVTIVDDALVEPSESVLLRIASVENGLRGVPHTLTLTIVSDDVVEEPQDDNITVEIVQVTNEPAIGEPVSFAAELSTQRSEADWVVGWDFDVSDGIGESPEDADAVGMNVTWSYDAPGVYTVTLRVWLAGELLAQATAAVRVLADEVVLGEEPGTDDDDGDGLVEEPVGPACSTVSLFELLLMASMAQLISIRFTVFSCFDDRRHARLKGCDAGTQGASDARFDRKA